MVHGHGHGMGKSTWTGTAGRQHQARETVERILQQKDHRVGAETTRTQKHRSAASSISMASPAAGQKSRMLSASSRNRTCGVPKDKCCTDTRAAIAHLTQTRVTDRIRTDNNCATSSRVTITLQSQRMVEESNSQGFRSPRFKLGSVASRIDHPYFWWNVKVSTLTLRVRRRLSNLSYHSKAVQGTLAFPSAGFQAAAKLSQLLHRK